MGYDIHRTVDLQPTAIVRVPGEETRRPSKAVHPFVVDKLVDAVLRIAMALLAAAPKSALLSSGARCVFF